MERIVTNLQFHFYSSQPSCLLFKSISKIIMLASSDKPSPIVFYYYSTRFFFNSEQAVQMILQQRTQKDNILYTVWSEGFLYKVASLELKISPIMYFVIHNSVVLSKILKIVVPFWPLFAYVDHYQNNQFYIVKISFFKILL